MQLYDKIMESYQSIVQYMADHPIVLGAILLFVLLAGIGAWYVLSHHLRVLLVTMLCAGGFAAGVLVLYRGVVLEMNDLIGAGLFLVLIFPLIYREAVRVAAIAFGGDNAMSKGHAKRAGM